MRDYVWVIIAVVAFLLFVAICVSVGIFFWKMFRYRPRRVLRVSPTTVKPIQPIPTVESQYKTYAANYMNNNNNNNNNTEFQITKGKREYVPQRTTILQPEHYVQKESIREPQIRNWGVRSIESNSIEYDDPSKSAHGRLKRQSKGFVDRDPPSEESRSDFLDPVDFEKIQEIYSESQVSYDRRQPLTSIECTYREDHRYFRNNDRLI